MLFPLRRLSHYEQLMGTNVEKRIDNNNKNINKKSFKEVKTELAEIGVCV